MQFFFQPCPTIVPQLSLEPLSHIFLQLLTSAVWKLVQDEVAATKKPVIRFRVDFAGTTADVEEEGDDAPEVKGEGKVISLVLSQAQVQ